MNYWRRRDINPFFCNTFASLTTLYLLILPFTNLKPDNMNSLQTFVINGWFVTTAHNVAEAYANFRDYMQSIK